jgi:putative oxidoreductase-like protein
VVGHPDPWSRLLYYARLGALVQAHLSARAVSLAAGCCSGRLNGIVTVPSLEALVSCHGGRFRENLLFTHRGLSGPAILQISSYWTPGEPINIDLLPERSGEAILSRTDAAAHCWRPCFPKPCHAASRSSGARRWAELTRDLPSDWNEQWRLFAVVLAANRKSPQPESAVVSSGAE